MFNSLNNNVSRNLLTVSALEHPASAGWNCGTSPLTPQGKWFMRLFKLGSVKGPLYWALKLMCQARLEPELTFGCPGWPFEINSKEHHSSCGAMAHLMDLKFNKHCHRMWESKLLFFYAFVIWYYSIQKHVFTGRTISSIFTTSTVSLVTDRCIIGLVDC